MLPQTHMIIAGVIYDDIRADHKIELNKTNLIYGSVKPDLYSGLPKLKHFKPQSFSTICGSISDLSGGKIEYNRAAVANLSKNIGIVTHYVADYFCAPHNDRLTYQHHIIDHLKYENSLHKVFDKTPLTQKKVMPTQWLDFSKPEQVMNYLDELHRYYVEGHDSFLNDLIGSLQATRAVASMIVREAIGPNNIVFAS